MNLDWNNIDKSSRLINSHFFRPFYVQLSSISKEYRFVQLSAPFVGAIDAMASLVQAVGCVAESTIKGIRNLLQGTLDWNSELLKKGGLQIVLGGGLVGVVSIPVIAIRTLRITVGMLTNPEKTASIQAENYIKEESTSAQAPLVLQQQNKSSDNYILLDFSGNLFSSHGGR